MISLKNFFGRAKVEEKIIPARSFFKIILKSIGDLFLSKKTQLFNYALDDLRIS